MKQIVFINAHCNHLLMSNMQFYLFGIKAPAKYNNLLKGLLEREDVEIVNYVTASGNIIPRSLDIKLPVLFAKKECEYVLRKNLIDKIRIVTTPKELADNATIISFIHGRCSFDGIEKLKGHKILHLNQYTAHSLEELNSVIPLFDQYILEADVMTSDNYLLRSNIAPSSSLILIPYVVADRFVNKIPFENRKNKAVATGTIASFSTETDCSRHYGTKLLHKMRQEIFDNREKLLNVLDSFLSPYRENKKQRGVGESKGKWSHYLGMIFDNVFTKSTAQKKYFSFDIVEKYNEYAMAVVPEEISGIPAVGAFEAMACGCAFIGIKSSMYTNLGLVPNIHYITYDGTIDGLKQTIEYYQNHPLETAKIAMCGMEYVNLRFRRAQVANNLVSYLK